MVTGSKDLYSAGEQGLGYIYQPRFALLKLLQLPESSSVLIEKDDDLDFIDQAGAKTLASLKHKAVGERLSDLSIDFWKSVRIWLTRYISDGRSASNLRFFIFTTAAVSESSFLKYFLFDKAVDEKNPSLSKLAEDALAKTKSETIKVIAEQYLALPDAEREDFLSRIVIFDSSPRIEDLPSIIKDQYMRSVRREFRAAVFERLEGWWHDSIINLLVGKRAEPIHGYEISDKLSAFSEEYKSDNLPINFRGSEPKEGINAEKDTRLFVIQLKEIGITPSRLRSAILDYYRAFEQRSSWTRQNLLIEGEMEEYEERIVEEWGRYKDVIFEGLDEGAAETNLQEMGRALYEWAELHSSNISALRIRERVTEPYVLRGAFHILANNRPIPRVHWHPFFLARVGELLEVVG